MSEQSSIPHCRRCHQPIRRQARSRILFSPAGHMHCNTNFPNPHPPPPLSSCTSPCTKPGDRQRDVEGFHVENYFAQQPSGRNLLHVHPPAPFTAANAAAQSAAEKAAQVVPPSTLGTYQEDPSGRSLLRSSGGTPVGERTVIARQSSGVDISPETSDDTRSSSRWDGDDSDAQSHPHSSFYPPRDESGRKILSGAVARSAQGGSREGSRGARASREVPSTPGSEAASRMVDSFADDDYSSGEGRTRVGTNLPPVESHQPLAMQTSSSSSTMSRMQYSDAGDGSQGIIGQGSWRSSGSRSGAEEGNDRYLSSSDAASAFTSAGGQAHRGEDGQEDGDFGAVWLEKRAHARQFDAHRRG